MDGIGSLVLPTGGHHSWGSVVFNALSSPLGIAVLALGALMLARSMSGKYGSPEMIPSWCIVEVALTKAVLLSGGLGSRVLSTVRQWTGDVYGLSKTHAVLYKHPDVDRIFAKAAHLDTQPLAKSIAHRVFGARKSALFRDGFSEMGHKLTGVVEKEFVNENAAIRALERADLPRRVTALLSYESDTEKQYPWERTAKATVVTTSASNKLQPYAEEVNLLEMIRDFGTHTAISNYYGHDFLLRNPDIVEDFWKFDNDAFPLLVIGLPEWLPIRSFKEGLAGRSRIQRALSALYQRVDQASTGQPVDFGADLSDASQVLFQRNQGFREGGVGMRDRGEIEVPFFWGQQANSHLILFWLILYIYATPGLADDLRRELESAEAAILVDDVPKLNVSNLSTQCPLLKSTIFETLRLSNDPTSIRFVKKPLSFTSTSKGPTTIAADSWISAPHAALQFDQSIFPNPEKFLPDRFLAKDEATGKVIAKVGKMKPWGVGAGLCKGRTFAERQMMSTAACFLLLWDIETLGEKRWSVPDKMPGTGAVRPTKEVRVRIKRRQPIAG